MLALARVLLIVSCACHASFVLAQNVTDYGSMSEPYLLLLREPAVLDDLRLTSQQRQQVEQWNRQLDGPLMASRNKPLEEQGEQFSRWLAETRQRMGEILDPQQIERLEQIKIRVRGYRSLLDSAVARQLRLTQSQSSQIEATFQALYEELKELQERAAKGESGDALMQQAASSQQRTQKQVVAILSDDQKRQLAALAGRSFDLAKLAHVRFQAPEFPGTETWVNSPPLSLEALRGKVVALHFWAFG